MKGLDLLQNLGKYATNYPVRTAASAGIAMGGTGLAVNTLMNPIDSATSVAEFGVAAYRESSGPIGQAAASVAALGPTTLIPSAIGAAGIAVGAAKLGTKALSANNVVGRSARYATGAVMDGIVKPYARAGATVASMPGRAVTSATKGAAKGYGKAWDKFGASKMFPAAMGVGAVYGAAKAVASIGLNAPVYDSAMERSVEGSAYEQGPNSFGQRGAGAKVKRLGESASGLVNGLHHGRHG
jgi:hypothetical protein